ncbi:MAG: uroporphyrinogen-III synthase [Acidobacteria bacterium 13_1_20CM_2_60_10]|nr:MAG: uroporphyrinogen-III synthase [Acidobacteria bacterium 13_1_20CM_2_60_10]
MAAENFAGLRVLALESRRGEELARLIETYGGRPVVAPAMREVPLESNQEALEFVRALLRDEFDMVIFLTGVGTRALTGVAETLGPREEYAAALRRVRVVARGPKPVAALRELGVTPNVSAPEPNTWRELLHALDAEAASQPTRGLRIAVQEYGVASEELLTGLQERGARVTRVPVYRWALPEDVAPLRAAVRALAREEIDVVLFTTSIQVSHLLQIASEMSQEEPLRTGLRRCAIASIGPTTSEELRSHGLEADLEPSHPKMGFLVKEVAARSAEILRRKRGQSVSP